MSSYTPIVNYAAKDSLSSGDPAKLIKGTEITAELNAISTAIGSKADLLSPVLTGTPSAPTAAALTNTTQLATTAFANLAVANLVVSALGSVTNGLYLPSANTLGFGTAGVQRGTINATGNWSLVAPTAGVALTVAGFSGTHSTKIADSATNSWNAGFLEAPQNAQNAAYPIVLSDSGKMITHASASGHTYTIPANGSVAFPIGTMISIANLNSGGTITLAITTDTLVWLPSGSSGSRTLSANAFVTITKVTSTTWYLTGTGIS